MLGNWTIPKRWRPNSLWCIVNESTLRYWTMETTTVYRAGTWSIPTPTHFTHSPTTQYSTQERTAARAPVQAPVKTRPNWLLAVVWAAIRDAPFPLFLFLSLSSQYNPILKPNRLDRPFRPSFPHWTIKTVHTIPQSNCESETREKKRQLIGIGFRLHTLPSYVLCMYPYYIWPFWFSCIAPKKKSHHFGRHFSE